MHAKYAKTLQEQADLLAKLDVPPNVLRLKYRVGRGGSSKAHSCNHSGDCGRAGRRNPGWFKHGKGPANCVWNAAARI